MTTTTSHKTDLSKAGLLGRLSFRIHELEMERLAKEISAKEYRSIKANLLRQEASIMALAS